MDQDSEYNTLGLLKRPLWVYVLGVVVVLGILNCVVWFVDPAATRYTSLIFSGGFLLGMFAMYIAVHLYRWK